MDRKEAIKWLEYSKQGEIGKAVEAADMAIKALEQQHCEMTAEEYRQRMIQAFHNADTDELIAVCVLPTEKEFEHLEWLLKNHYKKEPCDDAISRTDAISVASGYCHWSNIPDELAKLPSVSTEKTGRWIAQDIHNCHTDFRCSECGYMHSFMHLYGKPTADYTYCPNCGARMGAEESESCKGCPNICVMYESNMKGCKDKMEGVKANDRHS